MSPGKIYGLAEPSQRRVEANLTEGRKREAFNTIIITIHAPPLHSLRIPYRHNTHYICQHLPKARMFFIVGVRWDRVSR
jgi:hypothetical protein